MKKQLIKEIVLSKCCYDANIYHLLQSGVLDSIIDNLDNKGVPCNVNPKNIVSSEEQFVSLLNRFFSYFKQTYHNIEPHYNFVFRELILGNINLFSTYLTSKHYLGDNRYIRFFEENLIKLSIANFIKNCSCFDILKQFMHENNIKTKTIENYSYKELQKIAKILSDMTLCHQNNFHLPLLFTNLESIIHKDDISNNYREQIIKDLSIKYEIIINEYNKKRKYVELLRN